MSLLDDLRKNTQGSGGGLLQELRGKKTGVLPTQKQVQAPQADKDENILEKVGSFAVGVAKEALISIPRVLATPFATLYQDTTGLITGERPESVKIPLIGEVGVSSDPKKALGQLGERAIDVATLGIGGAGIKSLGKGAYKEASKFFLMDAGIGAGTGAAIGLQNKQEGADLAKTTAFGATVGLLAPPILGIGLSGASLITRQTTKVISEGGTATIKHLEDYIAKNQVKPEDIFEVGSPALVKTPYDTRIKDVSSRETTMVKGAVAIRNGLERLATTKERIGVGIFREAPIAKVEGDTRVQRNLELKGIDRSMVEQIQRTEPVGTRVGAESAASYVRDTVQTFGSEVWFATKKYLSFMDDFDRITLNNATEAGLDERQLSREFLKARRQWQEAGVLPQIKQAAQVHQRHMRKILDDMVTVGRLSDEGRLKILEAHPNYIPHKVLDFFTEAAEKQGITVKGKPSDLALKGAKGSTRAIADPDIAVMDTVFSQSYLNELQKGMNLFFKGIEGLEEEFGIKPILTKAMADETANVNRGLRGLSNEMKVLGETARKNKNIDKPMAKKIDSYTKQIDELMDEAATLGARQMEENRGFVKNIKALLSKVDTRKGKIEKLSTKRGLISDLNEAIDSDIAFIKEIKKQLKEHKDGIKPEKVKTVDLPKGTVKLTKMNDGFKEEWIVPTYIARALTRASSPAIARIQDVLRNSALAKLTLTLPARVTRSLATTLSPKFAIFTNPIRDPQSALLLSNFTVKDLYDGFTNAFWGNVKVGNEAERAVKSKLHRQAVEKGLFNDSLFRERTPEYIIQEVLRDKGFLGKTFTQKVLAPLEVIETAGTIFEQTVRLAVFRNALKRGFTVDKAVTEAANATVDFGRKGDLTETINTIVPFFNAGVQGALTVGRKALNDPKQFARRGYYTAVLPAMMLYSWNREHESYQNIPQWKRDTFWNIMVSESPGLSPSGTPVLIPHYISIPKGIPQILFTGPVEQFFAVADDKYPKETSEFLKDIMSQTSPVDWTEGSGGFVARQTPVVFKQSWELFTNYNSFTGQAIVPDYVKKPWGWVKKEELDPEEQFSDASTTETAEMLGKALNMSPKQIEHIINIGVLKDMNLLLDLGLETKEDKREKEMQRIGQGDGIFTDVSRLPVLRSFFGTSTYGAYERQKQEEIKKARDVQRNFSKLFE